MKSIVAAFSGIIVLGPTAGASTIISLQSVTAYVGTTGNPLEVLLTNTGPSAIDVGAFTFRISEMTNVVAFTGANTVNLLDPYIFAGNSQFGPILTMSSGSSVSASDAFATPLSGAIIGPGMTVGLGRVTFSVAPHASLGPPVDVSVFLFPSPATSLSDPTGNRIPVDTLVGGTITVRGQLPEPDSLYLSLGGLGLLWGMGRRIRLGKIGAGGPKR